MFCTKRIHQSSDSTARCLPLAGLRCPKCSDDLTGLKEYRCPECGQPFAPENLQRIMAWWQYRPHPAMVLICILTCTYSPCSWLLWIDYSWNNYCWHWIKLAPGLPARVPMTLIHHWLRYDEPWGIVLATGITLALIAGAQRLGRHHRLGLIIVCLSLLIYGTYNAWISYALLRA